MTPQAKDLHGFFIHLEERLDYLNLIFALAILASMIAFSFFVNKWLKKRHNDFQALRNENAAKHPDAFECPPPADLKFPDGTIVTIYDERMCVRLGATRMENVRSLVGHFESADDNLLPNGVNDIPITEDDLIYLKTRMDRQFVEVLESGIDDDAGFIVFRWTTNDGG